MADEPRPDPTTRALAIAMIELLAREPLWVYRRVERIEFLDKARVRRHTSIDFALPDSEAGRTLSEAGLIPVSVVRKKVLRGFDLRDGHGSSIPTLTREQNAPITAAILRTTAAVVLELLDPDELPSGIARDLDVIAGVGSDDAWASSPARRRWERWQRRRLEPGRRALENFKRPAPDDPDFEMRQKLVTDGRSAFFLEDFAGQFLLWAMLPVKPGERRILKFAYEEEVEPPRLAASLIWALPLVWLLRILARSLALLTSLLVFRTEVEAPALVDCEAYHVEIVVPDELRVAARLAWVGRGHWEVLYVDEAVGRSHLYRSHVSPKKGLTPVVKLSFGLRAVDLVWAAAIAPTLTALVLYAGVKGGIERLQTSVDAATAVVVLLPALLAVYLVPREDRLVREMFIGLRLLVLVTGLIAFLAAGALALRPEDLYRRLGLTTVELWNDLLLASLGVTSLAALSLVFAGIRAAQALAPVRRWWLKHVMLSGRRLYSD